MQQSFFKETDIQQYGGISENDSDRYRRVHSIHITLCISLEAGESNPW